MSEGSEEIQRNRRPRVIVVGNANVDVLMGPTTPTPAFAIGAKTDDPITMYLNDIYTIGANLAGLPAVSVPCGLVDGLPVGLQIIGPHFAEAKLLNVALVLVYSARPFATS